MGRRARRRAAAPKAAPKAAPGPKAAPAPAAEGGRRRSRSAEHDEAARAALEPLAEGDRPRAVTVAAIVAFLMGAANLVAYAAGLDIQGQRPAFVSVLAPSLLLLIAAYGMWRARYWAVLGFQVVLLLVIILFGGVLAVRAEDVGAALVAAAVVLSAGALFWFLVKAMARIQMPERR